MTNPRQSLKNAVNRKRLMDWAMAADPQQVKALLQYLGLEVKE